MLTGELLQVDAVIAGAQKSATTSLAAALDAHPGVCLARGKEAHLFDRQDVQQSGPSQADLATFFSHRLAHQLLLDATPSYMFLPGCLEALLDHNPNAHVIIVLRDPTERAISHYFHERRLGREPLPLSLALVMEKRRLRRDRNPLGINSAHRLFSYANRGRYEQQLEKARSMTRNLMVIDFVDLIMSPGTVINAVFRFLGLEPLPSPDLPSLNAGTEKARWPGRWIARHMTRTFGYLPPTHTAGE